MREELVELIDKIERIVNWGLREYQCDSDEELREFYDSLKDRFNL